MSQSVQDDTPEHKKNYKTIWKLILILAVSVALIVVFNFVPAVRNATLKVGEAIEETGWYGPILLVLLYGIVVIPLGLPYTVFEMGIAILISSYWIGVAISLSAKILGSLITFALVKYKFREAIRKYLLKQKHYKTFEKVLNEQPLKFSIILRLTLLPIIVKSYGLAIPHSITFKIYMFAAVLTDIFWTTISIFLYKKATNLSELFGSGSSTSQKIFTISTVVITILILIYVILYTRKAIKKMKEDVKSSNEDLINKANNEEQREQGENKWRGGRQIALHIEASASIISPVELSLIHI